MKLFNHMVCIMKINKNFSLLMLIFSLSSCSQRESKNISKYDYYVKGKTFIKNIASNFKKQNNFFLNAYGINVDNNKNSPYWNGIHDLYLTFYSLEKLNLQQARKELINCIDHILNELNNNDAINSYLYKFPFSYKNLDIGIFFFDEKGKPRSKEYIHSCVSNGDIIYYEIAYPDGTFAYIQEETYEEALKKLNAIQNK